MFDHEWGHGIDDNDAGGHPVQLERGLRATSRPSTACRPPASATASSRRSTTGCGPTADGTGFNTNEAQQGAAHCDTDCSGVRDADWAQAHPQHARHRRSASCARRACAGSGPCGRQVHCAAAPYPPGGLGPRGPRPPAAPFNFDSQTAFIIGNKLFYQGSGNIGAWHSCTCGGTLDGCGATNGYMQWLAADDDNGNLNDGTPHMTAIFAAFNRHGIACATPTAVNSGCSGGPSAAPTLTGAPATTRSRSTGAAVPGATRYWVFRSEGPRRLRLSARPSRRGDRPQLHRHPGGQRPAVLLQRRRRRARQRLLRPRQQLRDRARRRRSPTSLSPAPHYLHRPPGRHGDQHLHRPVDRGLRGPGHFSCTGLPPGGIRAASTRRW